MSVRATTNRWRVEILTRVALRLGVRARIAVLSIPVVCGGVERKVRLRRCCCAKPACLRPPPLLRYHTPVTMSGASSKPQNGAHVLLNRPTCAYHRVKGPGVDAGVEAGVGGECRQECSSSGQKRDQGGPVGHASYSRSMLSMHARTSMCCLRMADVLGIVVDEEGWLWTVVEAGAASTTPAPLPSHDHQGSRIDLLYTLRARGGATTHQGAFGMVGARSSYCSLSKATLSAFTGRM